LQRQISAAGRHNSRNSARRIAAVTAITAAAADEIAAAIAALAARRIGGEIDRIRIQLVNRAIGYNDAGRAA